MKLSAAMREALSRLERNMVWIDGRSRNALVRRGLARVHGQVVNDGLLGSFAIVSITPLGLAALKEDEMTKPTEEEIEQAVAAWHDGQSPLPLHEYLGWTWAEYAKWVKDQNAIPDRPLADGGKDG